jgi:hypothetical protein
MGARLIIVSNRAVVPEEADSSLADELAATVKAALKNQNGVWFGWSGKMTDQPGSEPRTLEVNKVTYVQIDLSDNDIQEYCNGLANSVLWPILHYRVDLQEYSRADASGYIRVNQLFADHLSALMNEDDVVWVHDYHLMVLARELRSRGHRNRIGFFLPRRGNISRSTNGARIGALATTSTTCGRCCGANPTRSSPTRRFCPWAGLTSSREVGSAKSTIGTATSPCWVSSRTASMHSRATCFRTLLR